MNSNLQHAVKKLLSLPQPLALEIANFRFERRIGTESEAMRRLLAAGLKAESPAQRTKQSGER